MSHVKEVSLTQTAVGRGSAGSHVTHMNRSCVMWMSHVSRCTQIAVRRGCARVQGWKHGHWIRGTLRCQDLSQQVYSMKLLIRMCDMTLSYVWRDSFVCVTWLIRMCDVTHSYVCHDSFVCVTWLIRMCDMTHSYVCHDSFVCVPRGTLRCHDVCQQVDLLY